MQKEVPKIGKKIDKKKQGRNNRRRGKEFELKTRKDMESRGWTIFRNQNDVINGAFIQSKAKWNPFTRMPMSISTGFPDYLAISSNHDINFVECKRGKYLDKIEKEKCAWIEKHLDIPVLVAYPMMKSPRVEVITYKNWKEIGREKETCQKKTKTE